MNAFLVSLVLAQSVQFNFDPSGGRVDVRGPAPEVQTQAVVTEETSGDGYRLSYRTSDDGYTRFEITEPEGAHADVWEGAMSVHSDDVPTSFVAQSDRWYRIVLTARNGLVWERTLQAKAGMRATLRVGAFPRTMVVVQGPPPPLATAYAPMAGSDFESLKAAIGGEAFSKNKLDVLKTAARDGWFSIAQVGELVDLFDFGNDKVASVAVVAPHIVDRDRAFQLYEHFTFSGDKEKVKNVLARH